MKFSFSKNHRFIFYSCWIVLGLTQCLYTELLDDEAYYWVYSRFLDWGYFDHPPMIGLLIKAGYSIFPNELGVRLFPLLLNTATLVLLEKLIGIKKNTADKSAAYLFYTIVISIAVLQLNGFIAVPDNPLIFFTVVFFLAYQRFVADFSLKNTVLLGLAAALLFYSKYHAVLIVLFTLFSNKKLFSRYQTYLAGLIALFLFAPHLWWQYQHNWISIRYQLFESNVNTYKISYTTDYMLGQLLLAGPIAGFILLPAAFFYKPRNETEKALRFTLYGIYIFFFVSSFRGRVEANWTAPALIPLVVLSYQFISSRHKWKKTLFILLPLTLAIVFVARILMVFDLVPIKFVKRNYHHWKEWPAEMKKRTGDLPVVFGSSYQKASKYWFYSGQPAYSLNNYKQRKNNYNFWPIEDSLLGKPVYFMDNDNLVHFEDSLKTPIGWVGYKYDPFFVSFAKIEIVTETNSLITKPDTPIKINCHFNIPDYYKDFIQSHPAMPDTVRMGLFTEKKWVKDIITTIDLRQMTDHPDTVLTFSPGLAKGQYYIRFGINYGFYGPTSNSNKIELTVD